MKLHSIRSVLVLGCVLLSYGCRNDSGPAGTSIKGTVTAHGVADVDEARIIDADREPQNWLSVGRNYAEDRFSPLVLEELKFPRATSALVTSSGGLLGAVAGLALMRFTDRFGARAVAFYPALAIPVLLLQGLEMVPVQLFLAVNVLGALLVSGSHFGILSIAGIFYPSAIRASGAGWATSVAKIGAILGPIVGAAVLSSGLPIIRSYALLAVCPATLFVCALGIHMVTRSSRQAVGVLVGGRAAL